MRRHARTLTSLLSLTIALNGLAESAPSDITVTNRTVIQRCVIDGSSARMIAVGFPSGFNYAYDAQNCAPVYVWQGGFVDFSGETLGRGGRRCEILGVKQSLGTAINPLRIGNPDTLPESLSFKGYQRNQETGTPTFRFEINGLLVEQSIKSPSTNTVQISLEFESKNSGDKFYHINSSEHEQVTLSEGLHWHRPGVVMIPSRINKASISISLRNIDKPYIRKPRSLSGAQIYSYYCKACHSTDGTKLIGPTFKNLFGRSQEIIRQGIPDTIIVDTDYIRESITDPQAAIANGYENVPMPSFANVLNGHDINSLIEYLQNP